jgi:hypothetical protein
MCSSSRAVTASVYGIAQTRPPAAGRDPGRFFGAVITAGTTAIGAIFVSSLIDWYWILPRVSGIVRKAPCQEAEGQQWARLTGVWLFYRAVATLVATGCLSAVCLYMAQTGPADAKTIWLIIASVVAAATLAFNGNSLRALWLSMNSRLHVHCNPKAYS